MEAMKTSKQKTPTLFSLILAISLLLIIGIQMIRQAQATVLHGLEERANQQVITMVKKIRETIIYRTFYVENIARSLNSSGLSANKLQDDLCNLLINDPFVSGVYVGFEENDAFFICYRKEDQIMIGGLPKDFDPRKRDWYKLATQSIKTVFTPSYIDAATNDYIVTMSHPIYDVQGNLIGVVGLDITLEEITDYALELTLDSSSSIIIIDSEGKIIAYPDKSKLANDVKTLSGELGKIGRALEKSEDGWITIMSDKKKMYVYHHTVDKLGWKIGVLVPYSRIADTHKSGLIKIWFIGSIILVGILFLVFSVSSSKLHSTRKNQEVEI